MIFEVIWKTFIHFGYYMIYKGERGLCTNVLLSFTVQHFPDESDAQNFAFVYL